MIPLQGINEPNPLSDLSCDDNGSESFRRLCLAQLSDRGKTRVLPLDRCYSLDEKKQAPEQKFLELTVVYHDNVITSPPLIPPRNDWPFGEHPIIMVPVGEVESLVANKVEYADGNRNMMVMVLTAPMLMEVLSEIGYAISLAVVRSSIPKFETYCSHRGGSIDPVEFIKLYKAEYSKSVRSGNKKVAEVLSFDAGGPANQSPLPLGQGSGDREHRIDINDTDTTNTTTESSTASDPKYWATMSTAIAIAAAEIGLETSLPFAKIACLLSFFASCAGGFSPLFWEPKTTRALTIFGAASFGAAFLSTMGKELLWAWWK